MMMLLICHFSISSVSVIFVSLNAVNFNENGKNIEYKKTKQKYADGYVIDIAMPR